MMEEQNKHYFEIGREFEKSERITIYTKEFWYGIFLGILFFYCLSEIIKNN